MSANTEIETLQEEAKERLSLDSLPDFVPGVVTLPNGTEVQAELYKHFYVYCNKDNKTHPLSQSWNLSHLATGKTIVIAGEIPDGGLNNRQAKRLAVWLSPLDWRTDATNRVSSETAASVDALVEAYADRDWCKVEQLVNAIDGRRLRAAEIPPPVVDNPQPVAYTTVMEATSAANDNTKLGGNTMSDQTAEMPVANGVHSETAPAKRGRRKRDPNSAAAIKRPGIMMKPVAAFNSEIAEQLAKDFGEKLALVLATGIHVLNSIPDEQKLEAFKQAKLENVKYTREERAKQNVPA